MQPNIIPLPQKLEFGNISENIHPAAVVTREDEIVLIDTGLEENLDEMKESLNDEGYSLEDVQTVLLTHKDFDHCSGLKQIVEESEAQVIAPEPDSEYISGSKEMEGPEYEKVAPDLTVTGGETINLGSEELEIISTPGHTEGHISVIIGETLIAGDALNVEDSKVVGPRERFTENVDQAYNSVNKLSFKQYNNVLCYHGGKAEAGPQAVREIYSRNMPQMVCSSGSGDRFTRREIDSQNVGLSLFQLDKGDSHGAQKDDEAMHYHEVQEEVYLILEGSGHFVTANEKSDYSTGDCFKLDAGIPRRIDAETPTKFVVAGAPANDSTRILDSPR